MLSHVWLFVTPWTVALQAPSVHGILQARVLEWVAISFSNAWKWKVNVKSLSRVQLVVIAWTTAHQAPPSMGFSRQEHWSKLPFPSPMHESEKWKWSHSVVSTLRDPMDCSLPVSSVHGILQARVLECGAIAFCNQIPLAFKVKFSEGSQFLCWIHSLGNLLWALKLLQLLLVNSSI